jgi:sugar phosphate isomerase/epimerase
MFAQQERFADMRDFARAVEGFGYDAIEVSHSTNEEKFARLLSTLTLTTGDNPLPISSIHAPAPLVEVNGRRNSSLNLASLDDDERLAAIHFTKRTIDHVASVRARYVVVHLGGVGGEMFESERNMRKMFDSGDPFTSDYGTWHEETLERRAREAPEYLERARDTLAELVDHARPRGIAIGIENRLHHHEIPLPDEALWLLEPYTNDVAGYWHDVGHAEVQSRLGYVDKRAWLDALSERTIGCHLHDVEGIGDHRAPGLGDVEWDYIAAGIPETALRVLEINQREPDDAVASAISFLRQRAIV